MKAYYHARAFEYDDWWLGEGLYAPSPPGWKEERDELFAIIRALPPRRTLDAGCGTGFVTRLLRGEVTGFDQSDAMLEVARRQAPHARYVQGDGVGLPFADDSFERVFTSHFYGHLEEREREAFLAEARRVAPELVVADAAVRPDRQLEEWQERTLRDGSRWTVFKRFFTGERLADELGGGEVLFEGRWFVVVRA